ncbi:MAG: hypothetical protein HKP58_05090 [Desulfatitalea sp.]|nr:hypothetical protein [Desulfatitalea sp.]NNJ99768.1 hypothetical protein [Desulfatitalea sp.]
MEDLIPIIFFIIISVISVLSKVASKKKKKGDDRAPARGLLAGKLNAFFSDIQRKLDEQAKQGDTGAMEWRRLMEDSVESISREDSQEDSLEGIVLQADDPALQPPPTPLVPHREKRRPTPPTPPAAAKPQRSEMPALAFDRGDLQRAIIFSEIIGPPLALRAPDDDTR